MLVFLSHLSKDGKLLVREFSMTQGAEVKRRKGSNNEEY